MLTVADVYCVSLGSVSHISNDEYLFAESIFVFALCNFCFIVYVIDSPPCTSSLSTLFVGLIFVIPIGIDDGKNQAHPIPYLPTAVCDPYTNLWVSIVSFNSNDTPAVL